MFTTLSKNPLLQNKFVQLVLVTIAVTVLWLSYLFVVGIPSTAARNLYNQAMNTTDLETKQKLLKQSLDTWYEPYVKQELDQE